MSATQWVESVRADDLETVRSRISRGVDVEVRDEHGWTALCWAAATGNVEMVQTLLDAGANHRVVGADGRTPYEVALGAGHVAAAQVLASSAGGQCITEARSELYCRAYRLGDLRRLPRWTDSGISSAFSGSDDSIVFVHADYSVTRSIWPGEDIIHHGASPDWRTYCADHLGDASSA